MQARRWQFRAANPIENGHQYLSHLSQDYPVCSTRSSQTKPYEVQEGTEKHTGREIPLRIHNFLPRPIVQTPKRNITGRSSTLRSSHSPMHARRHLLFCIIHSGIWNAQKTDHPSGKQSTPEIKPCCDCRHLIEPNLLKSTWGKFQNHVLASPF